jgi:NADH-quinone oxidoreductase subunit G
MPKQLIIDGTPFEAEDGITILQACEQAGIEIPRFCYHERLSIAGNCRMCLVEVQGMPKPVASCAMGVNDLPPNRDGTAKQIMTRTPMVKKAREGVMEFLLVNHPLDCPICDQGGECDLQDQAMAYGAGGSRYEENKRAVEEKYLGPLIKTAMTRCIQCTRCVRFMTEIAGVEELGAIGRGEDMEITTYLERGMISEMSANVVDLCPVGALTHRPSAFNARPWEMRKTETIDVMDAVGSAIRVDARGAEVMRILPRNNDLVNEEWISDKTRHVADGLKTQRLDQPYVRRDGKLLPASWDEALAAAGARLKGAEGARIGAIAGDLAGAEEMFALADLVGRLGSKNIDCRQDGAKLDPALGRASYVFNATIEGIERADAILLVGTNPRIEAPVLNARIRKRWRQGGLTVGVVGQAVDLTYASEHLGAGPQTLSEIADGRHAFAKVLAEAKHPLVIVGQAAARRADGAVVLAAAAGIALTSSKGKDMGATAFNVLHTAAARVAGLDLGLVPGVGGLDTAGMISAAGAGKLDVLFLLGADEIDMTKLGSAFVIYLGSHGDAGAHRADVILPGAAYTEKSATYANTEGRVQSTRRAAFQPGVAKEDWTILRALSEPAGQKLPYDSIGQLRKAGQRTPRVSISSRRCRVRCRMSRSVRRSRTSTSAIRSRGPRP